MSLKETYRDAYNKKAVREFLIDRFQFQNIVGLAGPDIDDYISWCKAKGYNSFEIYENDGATLLNQLSKIENNSNINLVFGDIAQAKENNDDTLYDLDFCASIKYLKQHVQKFKDNFIMTFSTRIGVNKTIDSFFGFRNESVINVTDIEGPGNVNRIYHTEKGKYLFLTYFDTSAMCCFAKIN